jgi:MoaA/NifB/PqqE/SkfB family radical SAM enzyme
MGKFLKGRIEPSSFDYLKDVLGNTSKLRSCRLGNKMYYTQYPKEFRLQLTTRCNLRCQHCFQWNKSGYLTERSKSKGNSDLDISIVEDLLRRTRKEESAFFLWGGEPLLYRFWDELIELFLEDPRHITISTNGLIVEKTITKLFPISENLDLVFSIDGFTEEHEIIRGRNTFAVTIRNLESVIKAKKQNEYKGQIIVNCTLSNENILIMYEFAEYCESLGIDKLIFGFPWYINDDTVREMDEYYRNCLSKLTIGRSEGKYTWHKFKYRLNPELLPAFHEELIKIREREWKMNLKFHPELDKDNILDIFLGNSRLDNNLHFCTAHSFRLAVWADGYAGYCGDFPELAIANLYETDLLEIWKSEKLDKIREIEIENPKPSQLCMRCRLLSRNTT